MAAPLTNPVALASPGLNNAYMATFDAYYWQNVLVPDYNRSMIAQYGDEGLSLWLSLYNLGMKRAVQTPVGWSWEKGFITSIFSSNGTTGPFAAGANATTVISTDEVNSLGDSYPIEGDVWMHIVSGVRGVILTKSGSTLTIRPLDSTDAFGTINAGDVWVQIGTAFNDGTDAPNGRVSMWYKYYWNVQTQKHVAQLTGSQRSNKPQWSSLVVNDESQSVVGFYNMFTMDAEARHIRDFAYTLFFGKKSDNSGVPMTSTGLHEEVSQRGYVHQLSAPMVRQDLITIGNVQMRRWAGNEFLALLNPSDYSSLQDSLLDDMKNTNLEATNRNLAGAFFGGDMSKVQALESTFNWSTVTIDGVTYMLKRFRMFDDPHGAGATQGTTPTFFTHQNYFIPMYNTRDRDGNLSPHIEFLYKAHDGQNRLFSVVETGRNAQRPTSNLDETKWEVLSETGWNFRGLTQFTLTTSGGSSV